MSNQKTGQKCDPLLLPFLETQDEEEEQCHLDYLVTMVDPRIKTITGKSLDSVDPEEVFQEARLRIVKSLRSLKANPGSMVISDFQHFVTVVALNARMEQMRKARPQWHRLKESLRHILKTDERFAVWEIERVGVFCGAARWQGRRPSNSKNEKMDRLFANLNDCETDLLSNRDAYSLKLSDLMIAIFDWADDPIKLDHLATVIFDLKRMSKSAIVSIDLDEKGGLTKKIAAADSLRAEWGVQLKQYLRWLWEGIEGLQSMDQRVAYLLNFEGEGYGLKLFQMFGVATLRRIGEVLSLSDEHFARLWPQLSDEARHIAEGLESPVKKFALLWGFLPIEDKTIADMLGVKRQRVINLRRKARVHLSRHLAEQMDNDEVHIL